MRLIHTSDWHLGRSFHGAGLGDAHRAFVDFLVSLVRSEQADAVLISGDVYDRALPPQDAVELFDDALARLRQAGAQVVVSAGNHDSAVRLGFGARVLAAGGVHLRTDLESITRPVLLGQGDEQVAVYGLPFLDPPAVAAALGVEGRTQQTVVPAALDLVRADLQERGIPGVVMAHSFVTGADGCDSERSIAVGGVDLVGAGAFEGFAYAALGHLHRPQVVRPGVVYCGSPVAMSFSESEDVKQVVVVDVEDGVARTRDVPVPLHRKAVRLRGTLDHLLYDPTLDEHEQHWVEATLTDPLRPARALEQLRRRFPHALRLVFDAPVESSSRSYVARTEGRSELDVCCEFLQHVRPAAPVSEAECALLTQALTAVRSGVSGSDTEVRAELGGPSDAPVQDAAGVA